MKGLHVDIETEVLENEAYRSVRYTSHSMQLVYMSLLPSESIGIEVHTEGDQLFQFESGVGEVVVDTNRYAVHSGSLVIVPAGAKHNVSNTSNTQELKLYTIYAPPHHQDGIEFATKAEAEASHEVFDDVTTE